MLRDAQPRAIFAFATAFVSILLNLQILTKYSISRKRRDYEEAETFALFTNYSLYICNIRETNVQSEFRLGIIERPF